MKLLKFLLSILPVLLFMAGCAQKQSEVQPDPQATVRVIINFDEKKPEKKVAVSWREGFTALRALQHAATISTYPVGDYVFVTEIDGIKSERGEMAWYYTVNDEATRNLAINYNVEPDDVITWNFRKDVCSPKPE
jgi:ABC-type Fe3+-hydroxamate transport system substrate-binding protein